MPQMHMVNGSGNAAMNDLLGKFLDGFAQQQGQGIEPQNKAMTGYERYTDFNKTYATKADYKAIADWYAKNKKSLPSGVYASENAVNAVANKIMQMQFGGKLRGMTDIITYTQGLQMFSAWRNSLSIYQIDNDIFGDMIKTPLPPDTPSDIFFNLPDFCVYVEFPHIVSYADFDELPPHPLGGKSNTQVAGFWAYPTQKHDQQKRRIELNICPNVVNSGYLMFDSLSIVLQKGLTVEQAFHATEDSYDRDIATRHLSIAFDGVLIKRFLAMLLWVCVEQPDIVGANGEPLPTNQTQYKKHKVSGHFVPPDSPKIYHVGKRLGGEIREYKQQIAHDLATNKTATKRPHIRRGHWHGYWTGTGQNKQFTPKWLSATFVNAD